MKEMTVYEMLGLMKDGKKPSSFIYDGKLYESMLDGAYYKHSNGFDSDEFNEYNNILNILNEKVMVKENKEDEQLVNDFGVIYGTDNEKINTNFENIRTTLYNIINEINKLKIEKETEK